MKEELITKAYEIAKERYAAVGVDVDKAMDTLQNISLSPDQRKKQVKSLFI